MRSVLKCVRAGLERDRDFPFGSDRDRSGSKRRPGWATDRHSRDSRTGVAKPTRRRWSAPAKDQVLRSARFFAWYLASSRAQTSSDGVAACAMYSGVGSCPEPPAATSSGSLPADSICILPSATRSPGVRAPTRLNSLNIKAMIGGNEASDRRLLRPHQPPVSRPLPAVRLSRV